MFTNHHNNLLNSAEDNKHSTPMMQTQTLIRPQVVTPQRSMLMNKPLMMPSPASSWINGGIKLPFP